MAEIDDYMAEEVHVVSEEDQIARVRNLFLKEGVSRALVYDEEPKGMITDGDIAETFIKERRPIDQVRVREIMTRSLIKTEPGKSPEETAKKMIEKEIAGLPVVKDGEVHGMITTTDLTDYFANEYRGRAKVKDLMASPVETIKENQSAFHAGRIMKEEDISKVVVTRDKRAIGIVTEQDLSLASPGKHPSTVKYPREDKGREKHHDRIKIYLMIVKDIMQGNLETADPEEDAAKAAERLIKNDIGSLVVTEDKEPIGILTKTDITEHLAEQSG